VADFDEKPGFYVVGIGASAGGLEALRSFLSRMPADSGLAIVVVVHLSPQHESHLEQLLQPYTAMKVRQVTKTTALEPNNIYVIPPNANLESIDTHLRLSELEKQRSQRAPIDHFLRTLAETRAETAIGVVLTGAGSDGALGIRKIKEHGGLTIAQDPLEAEHTSMPQSAIATGTVDLVLPLRSMAPEIVRYCTTQPEVLVSDGADEALPEEEAALLEKILTEVRNRTGQEFTVFRRAIVLQRVRRRMRVRHVTTLAEYLEVLEARVEEARALCNDLLLSVTEFFRDGGTWENVEHALARILERKEGPESRVRVWSIGCSTGEEAYSLAILLIEHATRGHNASALLQVFASELAPYALQQAREGVYPQEIAGSVSPERLQRFFVREDGHFRVRRELRDVVMFANHDLFKDPPYSHLDMIVCRTLLRNLRPEIRRGVLSLFYYALEPDGVLLIDAADQYEFPGLFSAEPGNPRLLRRAGAPQRTLAWASEIRPRLRDADSRRELLAGVPLEPGSVFRAAVERYTPPSVLIDGENRVVHFSSTAARFVRLPGGELTRDILRLLPETIAYPLRQGLEQVRAGQRRWQSEPLALTVDGRLRRVVVRVDRAQSVARGGKLLLVVLDDSLEPRLADAGVVEGHALQEVLLLRDELTRAQAKLSSLATHAPEAAIGDARELRVLAEELDDAREELQTVNEELMSLSQENQHRVEALAQVSNDLQHVLDSTGLATLVVDRDLKVVRFTTLATHIFRLQINDIGRPLSDIRHWLRYDDLVADVRRVIEHRTEVELEIQSQDGRWYLVRLQPYRSALRGLEGAVLVFIDVTARKRAELAVRESDRRKDEFLAVLAHELRNPLAPIGAGIAVLCKVPDDAELVRQVSRTMARQNQQLIRLVDDLLEVSRISGGKLTLRCEPVALSEVIDDAVQAVRPFIDSLHHRLSLILPPTPLVVQGDAARLTQVIANLLHNAARYTAAGGLITLTLEQSRQDALISVRDNGLGIAAEALPDVFEMFYQGRNSANVASSGLGIGLTLAKKLVEMHDGTIGVRSPGQNQGSTFIVRLPLAPAAVLREQPSPGVPQWPTADKRVLIVDDNADAAETLRLLMTTISGGEVQTASSGAEALKIGADLRPDVVLLDLGMPGMDGYEVARRMRKESWGKDVVLVALTGWGQDQHRRRSEEVGFDRHMTKPADPEALRDVLASVH
jgi:two-component system, chemotaxis family, CheB/CheR fusion protein